MIHVHFTIMISNIMVWCIMMHVQCTIMIPNVLLGAL